MKLINYNYGYYPQFECSIHGKITMTWKEWMEATRYLIRGQKRWLPSYPWIVKKLKEDMVRHLKTKEGRVYNIRVPATEAIVRKYNLQRYKIGNYKIVVI